MAGIVLHVRIDKHASSPDFTLQLVNLVHMVCEAFTVAQVKE